MLQYSQFNWYLLELVLLSLRVINSSYVKQDNKIMVFWDVTPCTDRQIITKLS